MATNLWEFADLESQSDCNDNWGVESDAVRSHSSTQAWQGTYSVKGVINGAYDGLKTWPVRSVVSGSTQYTLSFYLYPTNASMNMRTRIFDHEHNEIIATSYNTYTADTWTRVETTFTTGAGDTGIRWNFTQDNGTETGDIYIDAVMLETGASASTWVNYSSGTEIAVGNVGAVAIAGYDPTVQADVDTNISQNAAGAIAIAGYDPAINAETIVAQDAAGAVTITGHNPTVTAMVDTDIIVGNVGAVEIAGLSPTVQANVDTDIVVGSTPGWEIGAYVYPVGAIGTIEIEGFNPTVNDGTHITQAAAGAIAIAGQNPTVKVDKSMVPNAGAVTIAGHNPTVSKGAGISAGAGAVEIAGYDPAVNAASGVAQGAAGAIEIAGYAATITATNLIQAGLGQIQIQGYTHSVNSSGFGADGMATIIGKGNIRLVVSRDAIRIEEEADNG